MFIRMLNRAPFALRVSVALVITFMTTLGVHAQSLNWSNPETNYQPQIGGFNQREAVSGVYLNGKIYFAYTLRDTTQYGDHAVSFGTISNGTASSTSVGAVYVGSDPSNRSPVLRPSIQHLS